MFNQILWTAVVTPFSHDSLSIDYKSLQECLLQQETAGNGLVLLGSTGESLSLTKKEKLSLLSFVSKLSLRVPVICGVPHDNLFSAIEWIKICKEYNIQGFLASTPMYTKPGVKGQVKWFESLLDTSEVPMMLYNVPGRTGVELYPSVVRSLKDHENFCAIKEASGSLTFIDSYQKAAPKVSIYSGDDEMMPEMALKGAKGLVSVASNVWLKGIRKYVSSCLSENFSDMDMNLWKEVLGLLKRTVNPISIKALLYDLKRISSEAVRIPLSQEDGLFRDLLLEKHKQIVE